MANFNVTISDDRVSPLSVQEEAGTGFSHKFRVLYSDINNASATGSTDTITLTLGSTPTKWYVNRALVNVSTAFAGTGALTIAVGTSSNSAGMVAATSVLSAGVINAAGSAVANAGQSTATSSATLQALFTNATSGSPSALTAGVLDIYLNLQDASKLP